MTDNGMDINRPESFGAPAHSGGTITWLPLLDELPEPDKNRSRPAVQRMLQGDGANLILFNFAPGQELPEHKAAHPITAQCLSGQLEFGCEGETRVMEPGMVIHLTAYLPHSVHCPTEAPANNVLLLTMLTGEKHQTN